MRSSLLTSAISCLLPFAAALSASQWRAQSIYQVMTDRFSRTDLSTTAPCDPNELGGVYCGGTWQGLIGKLDYIQDMGFTAIWISPIVHNIEGNTTDGSAYHGYWADDIYDFNEHFGTAADLKNLSQALHNRNMYLMVDVVLNHFAWNGAPSTVNYSEYIPFNSSSYFHPYCSIDYNNATSILDCWEGDTNVPLPDLRTESSDVQNIFNSWVKELVSEYNIDGIRLDSYQQTGIGPASSFTNASGVYVMGEIFDSSVDKVCEYQTEGVNVLNYPAYYSITNAFSSSSGNMSALATDLSSMQTTCADTTLLGSFMENQDNPRFPSLTSDLSRAANAITFTMLNDGVPIIWQGQEAHLAGGGTPNQREAIWLTSYNTSAPLYNLIKNLNQFRSQVISNNNTFVTNNIQPVYWDQRTLVTRKGPANVPVVGVYTNVGQSGAAYNVSLLNNMTMFNKNEQVVDVLSCQLFTTDNSGGLIVTMDNGGMPRVLWPYTGIAGTQICTAITPSPTSSSTLITSSSILTTSSSVLSTSSSIRTTSSSALITSSSALATSSSALTTSSSALTTSSSTRTTSSSTLTTSSSTRTGTTTSSSTLTTSSSTRPSATCSPATIHFAELVKTTYGQSVVVTGNITALGSWSPAAGVPLNANAYTAASPLWQADVSGISPGAVFQYKFVVVGTDGSYNWQPGNNLQATAPGGCKASSTISNSWPSPT